MSDRDLEAILTPAARQTLKELIDEYKTQILIGAIQAASTPTGEAREISVRDLVDAVERTSRQATPLPISTERLLALMIPVGLIYGAFAIGFVFVNRAGVQLDQAELLALAIGAVGIVASATSYYMLRLRPIFSSTTRSTLAPALVRDLERTMAPVLLWRDIELASRQLIASAKGESSAGRSIGSLLADLVSLEVVSSEQADSLRGLLLMRNKVLHNDEKIPEERLSAALVDGRQTLHAINAAARKFRRRRARLG